MLKNGDLVKMDGDTGQIFVLRDFFAGNDDGMGFHGFASAGGMGLSGKRLADI